jgi:16S rRNA (guanine(527)-N(7))-methyltransferase RsmG
VFPDFPELTSTQIEQLRKHYELLLHWNRKLNLISVHTESDIIERHYYESLFLGRHLPKDAAKNDSIEIADLGSGAGFPGFVVAIQRPDCAVTLIESHQRKAVFLREAAREVRNIRVLARRAEDVDERFDWAISRAVRYEEIRAAMQKLAPNAALLTGDVSPTDLPGYDWEEPIRLPWGERRVLYVSRTHEPQGEAGTTNEH